MAIPNYLQRWVNIKNVFPVHLFDESESAPNFTTPGTITGAKAAVIGTPQMLEICKLESKGSENLDIANVTVYLLKKDFNFTQCMTIEEVYGPGEHADFAYLDKNAGKPKNYA